MGSNDSQIPVENERRGYFRIEDCLSLNYHEVPAAELPQRLEQMEQEMDSNFTVMSGLASISQQMTGVFHRIQAESPDIAHYLKSLDQKVDLLGRALLSGGGTHTAESSRPVNLSVSGMAFRSSESLKVGAVLELRLLLFPSLTGFLTFGKVVGCDELEPEESEYSHLIRITFTHMRESDRDVLARHIVQRQTSQLQKLRAERVIEE
jgi:hypothetical protein